MRPARAPPSVACVHRAHAPVPPVVSRKKRAAGLAPLVDAPQPGTLSARASEWSCPRGETSWLGTPPRAGVSPACATPPPQGLLDRHQAAVDALRPDPRASRNILCRCVLRSRAGASRAIL